MELERRWAEPHRHHHDREHLTEVLAALDELEGAGEPFDFELVRTAAWFHDAVYDPHRDDNEERSAALAVDLLGGTSDAAEVARLVGVTRGHVVADGDPDAAALCDADLSVLGADPERYLRYAAEVRREYAHVADADFGPARAAILDGFLDRPYLFATPTGRTRWEAAARANLAAEITRLRHPR
ncbi:MAG: HD domain-containing protein [Nocardioidaceae bacterium]